MERSRLKHLYADEQINNKQLFLHYADLDDPTTIRRVISKVQPTEFYHLAGQSHVGLSFDIPESTCDTTAIGTLRIMEILRDQPHPPRFMHASSREIFGTPTVSPQDENTTVNPNSPYGCAKTFATQMTKIYREAHGLFFCNAICYNHESPRRGENFVTRKVTLAAARIKAGQQKSVSLGDLDAARDWGYAKDYVEAMWLMLQQDTAGDYVLATGVSHTIKDLLETAFAHVGLNWQDHVEIDSRFKRPADAHELLGNPAKAEKTLNWKRSVDFQQLVHLMVEADVRGISRQ